jgi:hypothetical protein
LNVETAFKALFVQEAASPMGLVDVAVEQMGIGMTPAAAEIAGPAVGTALLVEQVSLPEKPGDRRVDPALLHMAHKEAFTPNELMTRIDLPFGSDGQILITCPASGQSLGQARTAEKIYLKMEKVEGHTLPPTGQIELREPLILLQNHWHMLIAQGKWSIEGDNRLQGNLPEAKLN